jgi:diadenosine tetraphosphate (Ap4A) HIT family hydrolase
MNLAWQDEKIWRGLLDGSQCPICVRGKPLDIVAELPASWVTAGQMAPLPGYAAVVSKRHVVEPFELSAREQMAFWVDALRAAQALFDLFQPIKMNYEIHGNTIPHLHMHLYPRTKDDPYAGGPIDPRRASFSRSAADLERIRRALEPVDLN